jgi:hypothetical protein
VFVLCLRVYKTGSNLKLICEDYGSKSVEEPRLFGKTVLRLGELLSIIED